MATLLRSFSLMLPSGLARLTAVLPVAGHKRSPSFINLHPLPTFSSHATDQGTSDGVAVDTAVNSERPGQTSETHLHEEKCEQVSHEEVAHDHGNSATKSKRWRYGSSREQEDGVVLKVLPGLGDPKALKFRLGKKHVTMDSVREKRVCGEGVEEGEVELRSSVGDLPKSMEGFESTETAKLVQGLRKKLSLSEKDQSLYSNALPSVFGTSVGGAKEIAKTIKRAGFKKSEVSSVLPRYPNIVDVNYDNVARVYKVLQKEYKMNRKWLQGLLRRHPYLFTLEEGAVRERMDSFVELGLRSREIASLILHHPLLLFCPLSTDTLERAQQANEAGLSSKWLTKSLLYNLHYRPARIDFGDDLDRVVQLLEDYDVNTADVLTAHPQMLALQAADMEAVIHLLSSSPLYLNSQDIRLLLDRLPDLFTVTDTCKLRTHLSLLCDILGSSEYVRFIFRSVVSLLHPDCDIQGKLDVLAGKGFSKEQASSLVTQCPSLLCHDTATEFIPKLELLMHIAGVGPAHLTKSPRSYFLTPLEILKARYNFAQQHNAKLLKASKLMDLFCTTDKEFAVLCGVALSDYYNETGLTPMVRRRGRPRKHHNIVSKYSSKGTTNVTDLKTDLSAFDIEDGVNVESELDLEIATIGLDGMGMESEDGELGIECETSQDGLNQVASSTLRSDDAFNIREDFDDLLQYGISTTGRTASFNSSSPQIYRDRTTLKTDCLRARHVEASQLQFASKNFSKNVHRLGLGGEESQGRSIVEGLSHSVGPDFTTTASRPNQHHLGQGEALRVLTGGRVSGGDRSGGPSLLELVEDTQAAVQTEIQDNTEEHDIVKSGREEEEEEEEGGAVDLDSFVSKEVSDLLQELRTEATRRESGHPAVVKGMVRIGEIDNLPLEDTQQFDFVDNLIETADATNSSYTAKRNSVRIVS